MDAIQARHFTVLAGQNLESARLDHVSVPSAQEIMFLTAAPSAAIIYFFSTFVCFSGAHRSRHEYAVSMASAAVRFIIQHVDWKS